jgi:aerobic-type carbon monoxide dehydrogenase small subunit (CoxS/CutS family)
MSVKVEIGLRLNGVERRVSVPAAMSVLDMLRDVLGLTGTKYGCGEGECGACTVKVDGLTVNSCLMFAVDCDGRELQTIEGFATSAAGERLAESFVAHGAVQCGFCTPGIMMQAGRLVEQGETMNPEEIKRGIEGNLCRCTGYRKIIEAIEDACQPQAK